MTVGLVDRAVALAAELQARALGLQTVPERRQQAELARMLQNPADKATLVQLTDQAFRSSSAARIADQFIHILDVQGIPRFFNPFERALLKGFQVLGDYVPSISVPLVKEHLRHETANVIVPAERELLERHLARRRGEGLRMNVNFLGEAILSEAEAERRIARYLEALARPGTEVFSIKISTLYSQMSPLARDHSLAVLGDRLEGLYLRAMEHRFVRADGTSVPKFLYLDMEEYRDLSLTCELFMATLDRPGLETVEAGIVLQAYIPDSHRWQRTLLDWARRRVAAGGGEITIRLVKGANLAMERHEASVKGWPQAPFESKLETDANYKRMLHTALLPENLAAARIGVASHNLFEVAYALVLAREAGALHRVQFEMLEGMANHQRRALSDEVPDLLLYAPVCDRGHFLSAVSYLIRRLDENTGPENFLRHSFRLEPGSGEWRELEEVFRLSFEQIGTLSDAPRRTQDRREPPERPQAAPDPEDFRNEPDTDWSLPHHAEWARSILDDWRERFTRVPLVVAGREIGEGRDSAECPDPSRPGGLSGRYLMAGAEDVEEALSCAAADPEGWRTRTATERRRVLRAVAQELRKARGTLMGAALANTGKTLAESDPEVSEAVDFVEFYATSALHLEALPGVEARGKGVVVVLSPWNFPIAIPCGGIAAALAAGNTVILKPSSDAVVVAWYLCQAFWKGGVPRRVLQFLPCPGAGAGARLVHDPRVDAVILTGSTGTARELLRARPDLPLSAETGGKNATLVTAMADREQAIKSVLHSAFSHAGQKCSATSLLLLEAEVYHDPDFKRALVEAAASLRTGSAWDLETRIGPLIRPPAGALAEALRRPDPGASWALEPRQIGNNPRLWSPGILWGVVPGSVAHRTEFFGPVLAVMCFESLAGGIDLVHRSGYGLTSALESLDDREQREWRDAVRAGNLYINRGTTGAIVMRQPFGGFGKSSFGPGLKAGGPSYLTQFMTFLERGREESVAALRARYRTAWRREFGREHDSFQLAGQQNLRRYLPVRRFRIRIDPRDCHFEVVARVIAAKTAGCGTTISLPPGSWHDALASVRLAGLEMVEESDEDLAAAIAAGRVGRVRYAARERVPEGVRRAAAGAGVHIADAPVLSNGRLELLHCVEEQSISFDYHRYGNVTARPPELSRSG